jgi:hypothetical protein
MYPIDERDRVGELDGIPKPVTGAPEPIVVADEQAVVVSYVAEYPKKFCSVRFHLAHTHLFGAPTTKLLRATHYGIVASVFTGFFVWNNLL